MSKITELFAPQGAICEAIDGFSPRPAQTQMAVSVEHAINEQQALIVEAGTGTGKTFATDRCITSPLSIQG